MIKSQKALRMAVDCGMTVLLMFLMAFQVTEAECHEWLGVFALLLFLFHNILNYRWYTAIGKGRFSAGKALRLFVNLSVMIAVLAAGYSGMVMSRHVFTKISVPGGLATARQMHLAASYWSFVCMGMHSGMHGGMIAGQLELKKKPVLTWVIRGISTGVAFYGAIVFGTDEIYRNMFLINQFAILDYDSFWGVVLFNNLAMFFSWCYVGYYLLKGIQCFFRKEAAEKRRLHGWIFLAAAAIIIVISVISMPEKQELPVWGQSSSDSLEESSEAAVESNLETAESSAEEAKKQPLEDGFIRIKGGTFLMGSPEEENWRVDDEALHEVTVDDFYISPYEVTGTEYKNLTGRNPSMFTGDKLPVENVSWMDAVHYCNRRSEEEGLTPAYEIDGGRISWNRAADGYRLPTEAEWEYACRAGTETPFHTEDSIGADRANFYGHYPYEIENNYFSQENLTTKPGEYRQTTVAVDSFEPNGFGLYNMHGNVSEWVWDYYGAYNIEDTQNPAGPSDGIWKVYRGGGWNDFAKNMRSAYRGTLEASMCSFNLGIRLVRNAVSNNNSILESRIPEKSQEPQGSGKVLIAYFSWSGNTKGAAEEIQRQTGGDLFEITLAEPYSSDYNTVLEQSQRDQNIQARPEISGHVDNMEIYDTILLGYPNWWASIPMPIASFLEEYDFAGKKIVPFCSHGGGRFGQSISAIAKLAPEAVLGNGLSIHYSGGSSLSGDIKAWLEENGVKLQ